MLDPFAVTAKSFAPVTTIDGPVERGMRPHERSWHRQRIVQIGQRALPPAVETAAGCRVLPERCLKLRPEPANQAAGVKQGELELVVDAGSVDRVAEAASFGTNKTKAAKTVKAAWPKE